MPRTWRVSPDKSGLLWECGHPTTSQNCFCVEELRSSLFTLHPRYQIIHSTNFYCAITMTQALCSYFRFFTPKCEPEGSSELQGVWESGPSLTYVAEVKSTPFVALKMFLQGFQFFTPTELPKWRDLPCIIHVMRWKVSVKALVIVRASFSSLFFTATTRPRCFFQHLVFSNRDWEND